MPSISKKALAAIEAVVYIACKPGTPIRSTEISKYQGVTERYLEPIMQEFVHQKVLRGVRGPKGGYVLSKEKRKVTLKDIVEIVESLENNKREGDSQLFQQIVAPIWTEANHNTMEELGRTSLQDLCDRANAAGVIGKDDKADFNI